MQAYAHAYAGLCPRPMALGPTTSARAVLSITPTRITLTSACCIGAHTSFHQLAAPCPLELRPPHDLKVASASLPGCSPAYPTSWGGHLPPITQLWRITQIEIATTIINPHHPALQRRLARAHACRAGGEGMTNCLGLAVAPLVPLPRRLTRHPSRPPLALGVGMGERL